MAGATAKGAPQTCAHGAEKQSRKVESAAARVRPDVPKALIKVIKKSLQLNPQNRYPSVREMALDLANVLSKVKARDDFYELLAQSVCAAREEFHMGRRTMAPLVDGENPSDESEIEVEMKDKAITRRFFDRITSFMR